MENQLDYVCKELTMTRHKFGSQVPFFGLYGAPWTLLCYMVEGDGSKILLQSDTYVCIGEGQKSDREDILVVCGIDRSTGERWSIDHLGFRFLHCRVIAFRESSKVVSAKRTK